ncbi:hypothetical protein K438DRAFT_1987674 [Mycena galopus ATCC 62051]|nr:hypothetical protein K438DRAFT_1987674 [Mycena galopus ATCC 62051]
MERATLYDLQYYSLAALFLDGSYAPQACSTLIGIGLRLAQDSGLHVRKIPAQAPTERGCTCALQYEDFDVDPLIEVDDKYWGDPLHLFHQPPGVPSRVGYFNAVMSRGHLRAFCVQAVEGKPSPSCTLRLTPGSRRFHLICQP